MTIRVLVVMISMFTLVGCFNGRNTHVSLGDVSIGKQLIDLKLALESDAMSQDEYDETKKTLLSLNAVCQNTTQDDE